MPDYFHEAAQKSAAVASGACIYNPVKHYILPEGDFIKSVRTSARQIGCRVADSLFLYRHNYSKAFVLAYWVPECIDVKAMCEVFLFEENPNEITKKPLPSKDEIIEALRPRLDRQRESLRRLKEEEYENSKLKNQKEENTKAYAHHLQLEGKEEEAEAVRSKMAAVAFPAGVSL